MNRISMAFALCALSLLIDTANTRADEPAIKIGALLCLSGGCQEPGTNALRGAELAVEEINRNGGALGRRLELTVQDTKEDSGGPSVVSAFQALLRDGAHFLVGPTWTVGGLPLIPLMRGRRDVLMSSPSLGVADFNESSDYLFNLWPHDSSSTAALAKLAVERGWKRAAILSNQNPWESVQGRAFAEELKKLGGEVTVLLEPLGQTQDLRAEVLKIRQAAPDVVFLCNYTQMDIAAKELQKQQVPARKMAILMDETRIANSSGALDGTIYARYPDPTSDFATRYERKFAVKPGIASDTGYDAVRLYARAIAAAGTEDATKVRDQLAHLSYEGASGKIVFDGKGGVVKAPQFWIVQDGKQQVWKGN